METNVKELDVKDEELEDPEELRDENDQDITDWKAIALKNHGIAKRYQTKLQKIKETEAEKAKASEELKAKGQSQDKKEFDYAEKAYLKAMGIEKEEFSFVLKEMQSTGKSLEEILDSKYFQETLKEMRDEKVTKEAVPSGSKRSGGFARDNVEYWLAKGELPPRDQPELRRKVVNAKIKAETDKNKFSPRPVA